MTTEAVTAAATDTPSWRALVGGRWTATGEWREIRSPYSGEVVARVAWCDREHAGAAIDAAQEALDRGLPTGVRADLLDRAAAGLRDGAAGEEIARAICAEAGKPIALARAEVARAATTFAAAAVEARKLAGEVVPLPEQDAVEERLAYTLRRPVGVVGAITPFNFPLNLVAHKVAPALAAGCPIVLKPADKAPGPAIALAQLLVACGLPPGWLGVVVGPPAAIADAFVEDPRVRLIGFTGSAEIGWSLAARAAGKRVALELGNVTPAIVAADADVERAAERLAAGAFAGSGQACVSVQRIYVEASVHDAFVAALVAAAQALRTGDPADERTDVGPLIAPASTERLLGWIDAARAAGARVLTGGDRDGPVLRPTVLADVPDTAALACDEAFGPVVCVWPYDDFDAALAQANATDHGLQAGLFTNDVRRIARATRALEFGAVIVNDSPSFRRDEMPYGGVKRSGNTREGPASAVRELTEERLVVVDAA
jgi:acyl-CoA reductase-like NAD-dependent aldehyde dehydrogenase